jgi:hypothetical protein
MFEGPVYSREKNSRIFGHDKQVRAKPVPRAVFKGGFEAFP